MTARRTIADPNKLMLGNGELYFNDTFVGTLGGSVNFQHTKNFVQQRAGDSIAANKAFLTTEEAILTADIAEFKLQNLKFAFGSSQAIQTGPFNIIRVEFITLTATDAIPLGETADPAVPIKVFDTTRSTEFTLTTDYTFSGNSVTRVAPGAIADGQVVLVQYEVAVADATKLAAGGDCETPTFPLSFVHKECDTNGIQLNIFKAFSNTDFQQAFNTRESGDFTLNNISFMALRDRTKLPGQDLFEVITE